MLYALFAVVILDATIHALKDTLAHHWWRSIFAKFGELSFWGDANKVWKRRYKVIKVVDGEYTMKRKWHPIFDGVMDAWHLAESIRFGTWILFGCYATGVSLWYGLAAWAIGQAWFMYLYDIAFLKVKIPPKTQQKANDLDTPSV